MRLDVPFEQFGGKETPSFDMNEVAGKKDILFICLDTLRYDAAKEEEEKGNTPVLNQYGPWQKCQAPGNFTYPSHHAMFAGFLPCPWEARSIADRSMLFFPKNIGMGRMTPPGAFAFEGATIMEGLERIGYDTWCVGGVAFLISAQSLAACFQDILSTASGSLDLAARFRTARKIRWTLFRRSFRRQTERRGFSSM